MVWSRKLKFCLQIVFIIFITGTEFELDTLSGVKDINYFIKNTYRQTGVKRNEIDPRLYDDLYEELYIELRSWWRIYIELRT
jgi:hypothetical protein